MILRPPRRRGAERLERMDAGEGSPEEIARAYRLLDVVNQRLGGLTLLGLADTWLDFRRRMASPATGG